MTVWVVLLRAPREEDTRVGGVFSSKDSAERFTAACDDPNIQIVACEVADSPEDSAWAEAATSYAQFALEVYPARP